MTASSRSAEHLYVIAILVFTFFYLGGNLSSTWLVLVWLGQCSLGLQVLSAVVFQRLREDRLLLLFGPGYLVGYLITTWVYMLLDGGDLAKTGVQGLLVAALVLEVVTQQGHESRRGSRLVNVAVFLSLTLTAMTWEFPELIVPASGLFVLVFALVSTQVNKVAKSMAIALGVFFVGFGWSLRSRYWFIESDDLANRMAEGILSVVRGRVASVGAYPFDRYHWVSPVGTALQAELAGADVLFVFTVFAVVASLVMMMASFGLLLRSVDTGKNPTLVLLLSGTALLLWWKVQIDTEATVGRLAILLTLMGVGRLIQQSLLTPARSTLQIATSVGFLLLLSAMLYLYRPDLVVLMLLLAIGVVVSILNVRHQYKMVILALVSVGALVVGVWLMAVILSRVSGSSLSYAQLLVDWRPPDLGWCSRGSALRDVLCVTSLDVDLWAAVAIGAFLIVLRTKGDVQLSNVLVLLVPAIPSFFVFRLTLTSDFPSSIEGFLQIGLLSGRVLTMVLAAFLLSHLAPRRARVTVLGALLFAVVHINLRTRIGNVLEARQEGISGRLQGILTPFLLQWLLASTLLLFVLVASKRLVGRQVSVSHAVFLGFIAIGIWNLHVTRPMVTDVDESLIENVIGPEDVFEVGSWLRENTPSSVLIATNYQCRPGEFERCRSLELVGDSHPRATANWMLMAESRREFLYLSQPFYNPPELRLLHDVSITPGTQNTPMFGALTERGVDYFVACRECSSAEAWNQMTSRAVFTTVNFAIVKLDPTTASS